MINRRTEFPAHSTPSVDHFERLGIQEAFHPNQNPPPSPPPVIVLHHERYALPLSCTTLSGHNSQPFDNHHQLHSPDDPHEYFPMSDAHPTFSGSAARVRRWSSGGDDMSFQRRSLSNSSPSSIRNSPCISKSLEPDNLLPAHLLVPGASHDYHAHFSSNAPSAVDTIINSNNFLYRNPTIAVPEHCEAQNSMLFDTHNQLRHIPPMTHDLSQARSGGAEVYNHQYSSGSFPPLGRAPPYHIPVQPSQHAQPTTSTQTAGLNHDLHHQLLPPNSQQPRMIKATVTSRAVRKASNNRIRHSAKHVCPYCEERFTTSGNLRSTRLPVLP